MPFVETKDGVSLYCRDWGAGKPVVFVAGWALGGEMWEYQTTPLSEQGLRCIAYDKRGCGRSDDPGKGYDYDTLSDDLAAILERLDLRDVTLVSHSMGGGDVTRYLSRHGAERIARVALLATTTPFPVKTADNPDGVDKSFYDAMIAGVSDDRPGYMRETAKTFFGLPDFPVSPEMIQWGVNLALQASPRATIELIRGMAETDFRSELSAFTVPTLILQGDNDPSAPLDLTGRKLAQALPNSQLKIYEGAPHGLFFTHKDRLNADLLAFING